MPQLNSVEAAELVGTTPKMLRRYLRATTDFASCGNGGRYVFEKKQIPSLKRGFQHWSESKKTRKAEDPAFDYLDEDQGLPVEILSKKYFVSRNEIMARRRARALKLDARIREAGIRLENPKEADDAVYSDS